MISYQRTVELTSRELKAYGSSPALAGEIVKNEKAVVSWARHQSTSAISRLTQEATKIKDDLKEKSDRLQQVEAQIKNLETLGDEDGDDGDGSEHKRWFKTQML